MNIFKSKTINFSILLAIFGAVQLYMPLLQNAISDKAYGFVMIGVGIIVAVLRAVTTKPLKDK